MLKNFGNKLKFVPRFYFTSSNNVEKFQQWTLITDLEMNWKLELFLI